jgi:hypothetical protein
MALAEGPVTEVYPMWSGRDVTWVVGTEKQTLHIDARSGSKTVDRD